MFIAKYRPRNLRLTFAYVTVKAKIRLDLIEYQIGFISRKTIKRLHTLPQNNNNDAPEPKLSQY